MNVKRRKEKLIAASAVLSTVLSIVMIAGMSVLSTGSSVFAQESSNSSNTTTSLSGNATSAASSSSSMMGGSGNNGTELMGVIASLQHNEQGAPVWITSGHWQLRSDAPLNSTGSTEPKITNFHAMIYMTHVNGTASHMHEISDFKQTGIIHDAQNSTIVNGTMTITLKDGPHQNVSGYVHVENDMIAIWVDPTQVADHFGPTPIYGMIVSPEKIQEYSAMKDMEMQSNSSMMG